MEGLLEEYNSFIVSITSKSDPYSVNEIESLLVVQEEHIEKFRKEVSPTLRANLENSSISKSAKPLSNDTSGPNRFQNNGGITNTTNGGGFR